MTRFLNRRHLAPLVVCLGLWACGQTSDNLTAELTEAEKGMAEARYYSTDFAPMPAEVMEAVAQGPVSPDKALAFEEIDRLARPGYLEVENGYTLLEDGSAFVAVRTDMPGVTPEMIRWWFWWHALEDIRYKIWDPGAHYAIGVADRDRLTDERLSFEARFLENPHYPVENIGSGIMPLSIRFVSPETFGLDTARLAENGIEEAICGVVGFRVCQMTIEHTYMCHLFRKKGDGLELRSRFWLGKKLAMPMVRKLAINEGLAVDMLLHCSEEYTHLAGFLPAVFDEFHGRDL